MSDFGFGYSDTISIATPIILGILVLIVFILLFLNISMGIFRRKLPLEICKTDKECGQGLTCSENGICVI